MRATCTISLTADPQLGDSHCILHIGSTTPLLIARQVRVTTTAGIKTLFTVMDVVRGDGRDEIVVDKSALGRLGLKGKGESKERAEGDSNGQSEGGRVEDERAKDNDSTEDESSERAENELAENELAEHELAEHGRAEDERAEGVFNERAQDVLNGRPKDVLNRQAQDVLIGRVQDILIGRDQDVLNEGDQDVLNGQAEDLLIARAETSGDRRLQLRDVTVEVTFPVVFDGKHVSDERAKALEELVERVHDEDAGNTELLIMAPHGGGIEKRTDAQVERVFNAVSKAGMKVSTWSAKGWKKGGGAYQAWHITSNEIHPESYPELGRLVGSGRRFTRCFTFHGMKTKPPGQVWIGGRATMDEKRALKKLVQKEIHNRAVEVRVASSRDFCNGLNISNCVNWLSQTGRGGIQLEQDKYVRDRYWKEVADAVTKFIIGRSAGDE